MTNLKILLFFLFSIFCVVSASAIALNMGGGTQVQLSTVYYGALTTNTVSGKTLRLKIGGATYSLFNFYPTTGVAGEPFKITLTSMTASGQFSFQISASGNFTVDWGDNTPIQNITKADTANTTYSHTYAMAGNYAVVIGGKATGYNNGVDISAISFYNSMNKNMITSISGDIGTVFPILNNTSVGAPQFYRTFAGFTGWKGTIPANLFSGLHGAPRDYMFEDCFWGSSVTGAIPADLFSGLSGAPAVHLFFGTFQGCTGLVGAIPGNLFSGIIGAPKYRSFAYTFYGASGLSGAIPGNLFAGVSGMPAQSMFDRAFMNCPNLTSIGDGLFDGITGAEMTAMFNQTFSGCTGLAGPSAKSDGQYLYQKWPSVTTAHVAQCYYNATKLSDYASIPAVWK